MSSASTLIAKIDLKIAALLDDSGNVGDYKIGEKAVSKGAYLTHLTNARKVLVGMDNAPYEDISEIAFEINEFGEDKSEYIGDSTG